MSLLVAMLGLALNSPALAQPAASPANQADATLLYNEGVAAAKLEQWNKSHAFYLGAWRLKQHWQIAANLGRVEVNLGQHRGAAEHLTYFLREAPNISPADRQATQKLIEQAKTKVGTLILTVDPPGTELSVNGVSVGNAPLQDPVFVEPGPCLVEGRLPGYTPAKEARALMAGAADTVVLHLVKEPATVVMTPPPVVVPGTTNEGPNKAIWITGATTGAVAAGLGFGFLAAWKAQPLTGFDNTYCNGYCTHYKNLTFWSFLGAGLIGGATGIYMLTTSHSKPKNGPMATIAAGPDGGGVVVSGHW